MNITILDAPSPLGLGLTGVERAPEALRRAGLHRQLHAGRAGMIIPPSFYEGREIPAGVGNAEAIVDFSIDLADRLEELTSSNRFPIVLGGDCSITLGCMLALARTEHPHGLAYLDGHESFYSPATSPTGQAADMDLALLTGHGPKVLTNIEQRLPLVREEHVALIGCRDHADAQADGSPDVGKTKITVFSLDHVRRSKPSAIARQALHLVTTGTYGYWVHLDVDVLNPHVMPAVDYPVLDGFSFHDLTVILRVLLNDKRARGMDITVFNPSLDPHGTAAQALVACLANSIST